ncbi:hypothetical protein AS593_10380 [Caulobacter vibrioides]|nr:hypothetical protein AS593_10380 [Caulobacter vibrioides]
MSLLTLALAAAQVFAAPLDLPAKAQIEMTVVKTREDLREGEAGQPMTSRTVYAKTVEADGEGYRVTLKPTSTELPKVGPAEVQAKVQSALEGMLSRTYVYKADESLAPTAIEDWPAVVADMTKALQALAGNDPDVVKVMGGMTSMFGRMSPEQAAGLMLKEDGMLSTAVNIELEVGKPFTYDDQVSSPLGGGPIKANGVVVVERIDEARGVGVVRWSQSIDPESATAVITQLIQGLIAQMPAETPKPDFKAMMAKAKLENTSGCLYEIDLKTGLPVRADCESKTAITDPRSSRLSGRTERWAITQTLKN